MKNRLRSEARCDVSRLRQMRLSSKEGRIGEKASRRATLSNVCVNLFTVMPLTRNRCPGSLGIETTSYKAAGPGFVP